MKKGEIKILVIEDDAEMLRLLQDVLVREGYLVSLARDGSEALVKLREEQYDFIILDNVMPGLKGMEILPGLKLMQPEAAVILITAFGDRETYHEAIGKGATAYLAKPFGMSVLIQMIRKALEQKAEARGSPQGEAGQALEEREGGTAK